MSDNTGIEWTDATWNPVTGCTKVSPGCDHCYAETFAERWRGTPGHYYEQGFDVLLRPEKLDMPLSWKRPRRVFVNSMSDLFHKDVPDSYIAQVFATMALTRRHTFQVLTKRHGRMRSLLSSSDFQEVVAEHASDLMGSTPPHTGRWRIEADGRTWTVTPTKGGNLWSPPWPLPNVWLGVSVENQQWADTRIPALLDTPAAVRFLSCEPLLGPIDLKPYWLIGEPTCGPEYPEPTSLAVLQDPVAKPHVDWVIVGGESGHGARPMHPAWARQLRDKCTAAGVPFLFKQWGAHRWVAGSRYDKSTKSWVDHGIEPQRVGKHAAGRELDGRTWDEYPAERAGATA